MKSISLGQKDRYSTSVS